MPSAKKAAKATVSKPTKKEHRRAATLPPKTADASASTPPLATAGKKRDALRSGQIVKARSAYCLWRIDFCQQHHGAKRNAIVEAWRTAAPEVVEQFERIALEENAVRFPSAKSKIFHTPWPRTPALAWSQGRHMRMTRRPHLRGKTSSAGHLWLA